MIRSLVVKALVTNLQRNAQQTFFVFSWSMVILNLKMISMKCVFTCSLTTMDLKNLLFGLKSQKKMLVTFLYWFAAQQQTRTCRHQKSHSIFSKFIVEETESIPSFQNPQTVTKKMEKPNKARKYTWFRV